MNTRTTSSTRFSPLFLGLVLALCGGSVAAQSDLNTRSLDNPQTRVQSCNEVDIAWNMELIEQFPHIPDACHEVVMNNGTKWARFEAEFLRINNDGSVTSEFLDPRGRSIGRYTLVPAEGQMVTLDGRKVPFSALRTNQRINLYVPEGAAALSSEPIVAPERYSRIVRYEPISTEPTARERAQLADNSPPPRMDRLPDTAGPLPWFAALGVLSGLAALGLRRFGR